MKTKQRILLLLLPLFLAGCGFHLRGQNLLPVNFYAIKIESATPFADFESVLRRKLASLGVRVTRCSTAPVILQVTKIQLYNDVPTIGGSNQARVYVYYYQVNFDVLDEQRQAILPNQCVATSKTLIINAGTALESTNQLDILKREMQVEAAHMIVNILNSPKLICQ
jgi:LPS-assembly lipoprotein